MPKFKLGDHVERIGSLVPGYQRIGEVIRIIPNKDGYELFTEYEVCFSSKIIARFYETQLRLVEQSDDRGWKIRLWPSLLARVTNWLRRRCI